MKTDILDQIRTLDPARGEAMPPATASDPQLRAILAASRTANAEDRRRRPRRRPQLVIAAAATAAVAAAVAIGMIAPWNTPPAFASWTATPAHLSAQQIAQRVDQCPRTDPRPESNLKPGSPPLPLALADVRGEYTFVISTDNHVVVQCYLHTTADGAALDSTAQAGPISDEPVASGISTVSNGVTIWNYGPSGGGAIALAYGRAAPGVTSVTTTMDDGRVITATVEGGWWAMWAPGDTPLPQTARVGYADGSGTTASVHQPE